MQTWENAQRFLSTHFFKIPINLLDISSAALTEAAASYSPLKLETKYCTKVFHKTFSHQKDPFDT